MNVDWMVAIVIFIFFAAWSFSYYAGFFKVEQESFEYFGDMVKDKIVDFLSLDIYEVPIKFNSTNSTNDTILYLEFVWPEGTKNSTRVFLDEQTLPCRITNDVIYWQANLTEGFNYFTIEFANKNESVQCSSPFSIVNENKTIPWAMEKRVLISQSKIDEMMNTNYEKFRENMGINENFRIEIENSTSVMSYGKSIPSGREVYVPTFKSRIWESGENVNISIAIW